MTVSLHEQTHGLPSLLSNIKHHNYKMEYQQILKNKIHTGKKNICYPSTFKFSFSVNI
jgi:hypothetical protein